MDDNQFLFTFPLFSYLIEPGPRPGYLRIKQLDTVCVPLWTDSDLFETFLERSDLAGNVSELVMNTPTELAAFLEKAPEAVDDVIVDPTNLVTRGARGFKKKDLLVRLRG